jgi:hypothetical protein
MAAYLKHRGIPMPTKEHRFHPERLWRLDFAWVAPKVAIEVQGGIWLKGRTGHSTGKGLANDYEKHNAVVQLGWLLLYFTPEQMLRGEFMAGLVDLLEQREYIL